MQDKIIINNEFSISLWVNSEISNTGIDNKIPIIKPTSGKV